MQASAEAKRFYEWLKHDLIQTCTDERTLLEILRDIRGDREKRETLGAEESLCGATTVHNQAKR
jgi:hypothetical protein